MELHTVKLTRPWDPAIAYYPVAVPPEYQLARGADVVGDDLVQVLALQLGERAEAAGLIDPGLGPVPGHGAVGIDRGFGDDLVAVPLLDTHRPCVTAISLA